MTLDSKANALSSGYDLWVVIDSPDSYWWKELNFRSSFLLSSLTQRKAHAFTRSVSNETEHILKETHFPALNFKSDSKTIFIATENHFFNRWLCILENANDLKSEDFLKNVRNLKCNNLRIFFSTEIPPSLRASFPNIQIISDSH